MTRPTRRDASAVLLGAVLGMLLLVVGVGSWLAREYLHSVNGAR